MRRALTLPCLALTVLLGTACVGGSKEVSEKDKARLASHVLDKAPNIPNKREIAYDDKIRLLGYAVEPKGSVRPGQRVKLTMYWKVEKALGEDGWNLFTHVLDGAGERVLNIDNVGPLRELRGDRQILWPSAWKAGKVYVDEQEFTVPPDVKTNRVKVVTGIWKGNDRLPVKKGPNAGQNRGLVVTIPTTVTHRDTAKVSSRVPHLRVDKLDDGQKVKVDGKLDEDAWKTAAATGPFVDVRTGKRTAAGPVQGSAKLLWNDEALFVGFEVRDENVVGGFDEKEKDPHLWTKDTIEIMVDPDGDGDNENYYEIQINPQNLVFDSQFDSYNQPRKDPDGPFGHQEWTAKLESAVTVNGTLDDEKKDQGYVVEAKIPWKSFSKAKQTPPKLGDAWRLNLYAMQNNGGVAWSPILGQGNFHKASRFGNVVWAEKGWMPPALAAARKNQPTPKAAVVANDETASAAEKSSGVGKKVVVPQPKLDPSKLPKLKVPKGGPQPR